MSWPAGLPLATDRADATPTATNHPADHNVLAGVVNTLVSEFLTSNGTTRQIHAEAESGQTDPLLDLQDSDGNSIFKFYKTVSQTIMDQTAFTTDGLHYSGIEWLAGINPNDGTNPQAQLASRSSESVGGFFIQADFDATQIMAFATPGQTAPLLDLQTEDGNAIFQVTQLYGYFKDPAGNSRIQFDPVGNGVTVHAETGSEASGDWHASDSLGVQLYMEGKGGGQSIHFIDIYANGGDDELWSVTGTGAMQLSNQTDPSAPADNKVLIYVRDNGGKDELVARFHTGAIQRLAIEP